MDPAVIGTGPGDLAVFVPEFKVELVHAETAFELVESYPEYPGTDHRAGRRRSDGYPGLLGYVALL